MKYYVTKYKVLQSYLSLVCDHPKMTQELGGRGVSNKGRKDHTKDIKAWEETNKHVNKWGNTARAQRLAKE